MQQKVQQAGHIQCTYEKTTPTKYKLKTIILIQSIIKYEVQGRATTKIENIYTMY